MKKETIVSGIRATSKLQVGNFLGALDQFIKLQEQNPGSCYFFIADLHTLTTPFEPKTLPGQTLEVAAEYLAAGLNPETSTIFLQNQIHEHVELSWIFQCLTPLAELERMTQFKDKSRQHKTNINAGLLGYPVLMAADILMYKPTLVPVGDDQMQHLELARIVARKFNKQFGPTFPEPKNYALKPLRVLSLTEPEKKMGKSEPRGCLFIDDSPEELKAKLKKAVTGTDSKGHSKGAENLLFLLSHFGSAEHQAYFADSQQAGTLKYSELKEALADDIANYFAEFREKKLELLAKPEMLAQILGDGAQKAKRVAHATLAEVKAKIGLL